MKKNIVLTALVLSSFTCFGADTVFDSMGNATEVKLAPAIKTTTTNSTTQDAIKNVNSSTSAYANTSIKEEKFSSAIVNLDDAQVELRQELADLTSKYNVAVAEKQKATQNCKALKKEIKAINKNMKNIESAKKNINKNLETN